MCIRDRLDGLHHLDPADQVISIAAAHQFLRDLFAHHLGMHRTSPANGLERDQSGRDGSPEFHSVCVYLYGDRVAWLGHSLG